MSDTHEKTAYQGLDRRSSFDRRNGGDRRNLLRYESLAHERRERMLRRWEDLLWLAAHGDLGKDADK